jgi:hypothetical protein
MISSEIYKDKMLGLGDEIRATSKQIDMLFCDAKDFLGKVLKEISHNSVAEKTEQKRNSANAYTLQKMRDENGKEMRRGATVVRDPDEINVRRARMEFELRAKGYSFNEIRQRVIDAKLVPIEQAKHYFIASIEQRVKNPFYAGRFRWQGREYDGRHEIIIPPAHFLACQRSGRGMVTRRGYDGEHGLFGSGWLHCGDCGCQITYDPKKKIAKGTKRVTIFHYYRCTNGRRMHESQAGLKHQRDEPLGATRGRHGRDNPKR